MLARFETVMRTFGCHYNSESDEPIGCGRWGIDLPTIPARRLGPFRTKDEALDYRREFIIRTLKDNGRPEELPF